MAPRKKALIADTFANFAAKTGMGTGNLTDTASYGFNPISRIRLLIEWMYRGSWVCGNAVDCIADDMTQMGIDHVGVEHDLIAEIEASYRNKQIWQSLNQLSKWARLYGGAVGYLAIDGQDMSTPLQTRTVGPKQFLGIIVMDRWMVQPDLVHSVRQPGPDFGLPEFYDVVATSFQFPFPRGRIHHSRMIRMEGIELPFWQKISENMWGISILERVYDRLTAFDSVTAGASQLAYKAYLRTIKIKNLRQIIAAGGKAQEALVAQIELIRRYQMNEGVTLLDLEDEFETATYTFAGLADILNSMGDQIAGATQTPVARLFGQSPGGMNSTGDHELRTYYDGVRRLQERWFRRPIDKVTAVLSRSEGIMLPVGYTYEFTSLWQMTENDKSAVDQADSASIGAMQSAGIIGNAIALKELKASGRRTGRWQSITEDDIKEAEEADAAPEPDMEGGGGDEGEQPSDDPGKLSEKPRKQLSLPKPKLGVHVEKTGDSARMIDVSGLPIQVETRKGEVRKGDGWSVIMPADYGFIQGHGSAEGYLEQLDCFVGDDRDDPNAPVLVANMKDPKTGAFDEHKCMIGFRDAGKAFDVLTDAYNMPVKQRVMSALLFRSIPEFKGWLEKGFDRKVPATE